jgi:pimeloyl-ACP methyl ester carboxylesterase/DNA-binding CsgD family transcriptional regulator
MPVPQQSIRFCRSADGVRIAYAISGRGPVLVRPAHWMSHLQHDWDSPVWRHFLVELSEHFTLVRYDPRGCGLSDRDVDEYSIDAWVRDLEAVVDSAGVDRFTLLGVSQGGPIGIAYAVAHPQRVSRMAIYGSYARGRRHRHGTREPEEIDTLIQLIRVGWGKDNPAYRHLFAMLFMPSATPAHLANFAELQRLSTTGDVAARIVEGLSVIDVQDLATRVPCPTLVMHARGDTNVSFEEGRRLAALIPGARFLPLDTDNHVLVSGEPAWTQFMTALRAFVAEDDSAAGTVAIAPAPIAAGLAELSEREREILELMAQGLGNRDIARQLARSEKTIRNHVTNIFDKLGVSSRPQAIVLAREAGLGRRG